MATRSIVPRADNEGGIGTAAKRWLKGWFGSVHTTSVTDGTATATVADLKLAVDHKNIVTGNPHGTTAADVGAAPAAQGVTNGNTHDHVAGDGAQIDHTGLLNIGTNAHSAIDTFIASKAQASGLASLSAGSLVVQDPANATATPTANKIPIANASARVDSWVTKASGTDIDAGTSAVAVMAPLQFVASKRNVRHIAVRLIEKATNVAVGTTSGGDFRLPVVSGTIIDCGAWTDAAGTTGTMVVDINLNGTTIMATNKINIASGQKSSEDGGATQPTITAGAYTANGILTFDVDAIHTTPATGLTVWLAIRES